MPIIEEKTEFKVEVVRIGPVKPHPNADTLSLVDVNGYPVIIKTGSFKEGDLAVYVPVDSWVPTSRPEFAFLRKEGSERFRIRAMRIRGTFSMGLLVASRPEWKVGQLVDKELGIEKYLSPADRRALFSGPPGKQGRKPTEAKFLPIYGVDPWRKFKTALQEGEAVVITEKIHGCNARYCFKGGKLYVGSREVMRGTTRGYLGEFWERFRQRVLRALGRPGRTRLLETAGDVWWEAAENYGLKEKLRAYPELVFYGEIYGEAVQDLTYDSPKGRKLVLFDIWDVAAQRFLDYRDFCHIADSLELPRVPELYRGPWFEDCLKLAEGRTELGGKHLREGFVVRTATERFDPQVGRVSLKVVAESYLLRKEAA